MLEDIRLFVNVVRLGGFSRAAKQLKLPTSTISRTISRLEDELGTKLIIRTTRSLKPTPAGQRFYESCLDHVQKLEEALASMTGTDNEPAGLVRITASEDIGQHIISPVIGVLARTHPRLSFDVTYTDRVLDLVNDGIDIAIRIGKLKDSQLTARRVGSVRLGLFASPSYLEGNELIAKPQDLKRHQCLTFSSRPMERTWALESGKKSMVVEIEPSTKANQMTGLISIALQGAGIAFVPDTLCKEHVKAGRLVRVLPEWGGPDLPISIVSVEGTMKTVRHKIVSEHLAKKVSKRLN